MRIAANSITFLAAIFMSLVGIETYLFVFGWYDDLISNRPAPSEALWERSPNTIEHRKHPDLDTQIEIIFDADGIRNHNEATTSDRQEILAFFGDSFTENRAVLDKYTFTSLLDSLLPGYNVVNYGVSGYGLDQSLLRYQKFSNHDISDVIYVFVANDIRNLYETQLIRVDDAGQLVVQEPKRSLVLNIIGRFRLTYFLIDSYLRVRGYSAVGNNFLSTKLAQTFTIGQQKNRYHDVYADQIVAEIMNNEISQETSYWIEQFRQILTVWREQVRSKDREFFIVVTPTKEASATAKKILDGLDIDAIYLSEHLGDVAYDEIRFTNDAHWNEFGNIYAARALFRNFAERDLNHEEEQYLSEISREIDVLYAN